MVRRHINKVKRTYTRARGILGNSNILQNPYIAGGIAGAVKNLIYGHPALNIRSIQHRITLPNAKNPLIPLLLGYFLKNKPLQAIGAFLIVDPPAPNDLDDMPNEDIDDMSDEEIKALSEEIEEEGKEKKICIH